MEHKARGLQKFPPAQNRIATPNLKPSLFHRFSCCAVAVDPVPFNRFFSPFG